MIAVFEDRNKQYRVSKGDEVLVDFDASLEPGTEVTFDKVLYVGGGDEGRVGAPYVQGAVVKASVKGHERGPKIRILTYKRRKNTSRRRGHRQELTRLSIQDITG